MTHTQNIDEHAETNAKLRNGEWHLEEVELMSYISKLFYNVAIYGCWTVEIRHFLTLT